MIIKNTFLRILLIIVVIIVAIQIFLSFFLTGVLNKKLNQLIKTDIHLAKLNINLFNQSVALHNCYIRQPQDFSNENLIFLKKLKIKLNVIALMKKQFHIKYIILNGLEFNVVKNADNVFNFEKILPPQNGKKTTKKDTLSEMPFTLMIDKISFNGIQINYSEQNETQMKMRMKDVGLQVSDIELKEKNRIAMANVSIPNLNISTYLKGQGNINLNINNMVLNSGNIENQSLDSQISNLIFSIKESTFKTKKKDNSSIAGNFFDFKIDVSQISIQETKAKVGLLKTGLANITLKNITADSLVSDVEMNDFALAFTDIMADKEEVSLKKINSDKFKLNLSTEMNKKDSISISLKEIQLLADDLLYKIKTTGKESTSSKIELTAKMDNAENYDTYIGTYAKIGTISNGIPPMEAVLQVIGFELNTFGSILPPGTYQMLGGDAVDISTDLKVNPNLLDCNIRIMANQGTKLGLKIGGTPQKPELDKSSALFNVFTRFQGSIGGTIFKVGGTTLNAAKTGVNVASGVGKGAGKVVSSVGKGAFSTLKGIVTGNVKEIGKGVKMTTVGTITEAGKTVLNTGGEVIKGSGEAVNRLSGKKKADDWRKAKEKRWKENWGKAKLSIASKKK